MFHWQHDLELLDLAEWCCQNAGNAISETQIVNIFQHPLYPLEMCTHIQGLPQS